MLIFRETRYSSNIKSKRLIKVSYHKKKYKK